MVNGKYIRDLRLRKGLTQAAQLAEISVRVISRMENGGPVRLGSLRTVLSLLTDLPDSATSEYITGRSRRRSGPRTRPVPEEVLIVVAQ
jgi:transcriptional regulator with XRE-family HTH domain